MERMDFGRWRKNSAGGSTDGGGGYFIANPPFKLLLVVGKNVARRTEEARLGRTSHNRSNARIFASRVAGGGACIFACATVGAAIFGRTQQGAARACLGRTHRRPRAHLCTHTRRNCARMSSWRA